MEFTSSWGVERVWGNYSYYNTGEPAADKYAFVIDSGISLDTNDLNVNTEWAKSFIADASPFEDESGHGTAVASVIGAKADNYGLTGVAPGAQVVPIKVFGGGGFTSNSMVQNACRYVMDVILENDLVDKAVVNLSLGGWGGDRHEVIEEMNAAGIQVTISAGNDRSDVDNVSPSSYGHLENIYTVSSINQDGTYSSFTNYDNDDGEDDVDYAAPGTDIPAYKPDGELRFVNGTSFSAPHVAGLLLMGDIEAGPTFELSESQLNAGMVPDPLSLHVPTNSCPVPDPIYIEVPVPGPVVEVPVPGPVVEVPIYVEVPGPEVEVPIYVEVPVDPPQTTFVGEMNENNTIRGSIHDDVIIGGHLNDVLRGAKGNDYIVTHEGLDKVRGGDGQDTFVLSVGEGFTRLKDYNPLEDTIVLPSDDYTLIEGLYTTKLYVGDDLVARINGFHTTIM